MGSIFEAGSLTQDQRDSGAGKQKPEGLRSYGRRKGHRLSPRKEKLMETRLPELRLDLSGPAPDPSALFPGNPEEAWLEIGFGAGEHLIWQAEHHPQIGLIGCEPFMNGVASLLGHAERIGLTNIRVHDDDARDVLAWLPDASIARVFVLFPDPWPKKRHAKRRLIRRSTVAEIVRVLKPGGEFRLGSDSAEYLARTLLTARKFEELEWLAERPSDWRERPEDWPETRYEKKAKAAGRVCGYLRFRRGPQAGTTS
ncbi:tRNA (guanosine(46)-N7)-methyltransferase TrmB [Methyloligella solikamskensis]|uniref:tRNA (guanine-N(7)-)-methyltransferase n=1 Tax=Methyloligella solikamskensis TaxID=1177756 RepID=A0ABW3JCB1_9HYPH